MGRAPLRRARSRSWLARSASTVWNRAMSTITITVIDREGTENTGVDWEEDESLMECLVRNSFPILATCGGNASCSTCHSYLDQVSFETAGEIDEDEADVLDSLSEDEREPTSLLTRQVPWDEDLEGAVVRIGPFLSPGPARRHRRGALPRGQVAAAQGQETEHGEQHGRRARDHQRHRLDVVPGHEGHVVEHREGA